MIERVNKEKLFFYFQAHEYVYKNFHFTNQSINEKLDKFIIATEHQLVN
jgi:hypothetical protein